MKKILIITLNLIIMFTNKLPPHNTLFGITYEMSPVMKNYIDWLVNPYYLRYGLAIFEGSKVLGDEYQETIAQLYQTSINKLTKSPNSMHKYGSENVINSDTLNKLLFQLTPFIQEYYGLDLTKDLQLFYDFTVHYGKTLDHELKEHIDDSDITINICLRNDFKNTGLIFTQTINTLFSKKSNKSIEVNMNPGDILIHSGKQPHQVISYQEDFQDSTKERVNLILWLKLTNPNY